MKAVHLRINLRQELQKAIQIKGELDHGGPNNATVKGGSFKRWKSLKANCLVLNRPLF